MQKHIEEPSRHIIAILHIMRDIGYMRRKRSYCYLSFPTHEFGRDVEREYNRYKNVPADVASESLFRRIRLYYLKYPDIYENAVTHFNMIYQPPDI